MFDGLTVTAPSKNLRTSDWKEVVVGLAVVGTVRQTLLLTTEKRGKETPSVYVGITADRN
jgi:hypothetical protein